MPTYLYKCDNCKRQFEVLQSIREDPLTTCTQCGKEGVYRVVSGGIGVIFRGSGFYINDSKSSENSSTTPSSASKEKATVTKAKDSGQQTPAND